MAFIDGTGWRDAAEQVAPHHMRWRQMCLFAIEDHRDLEDFDRLDGLTELDTVLLAVPLVRGNLERGILWRAAYHELKALQAMRRAGVRGGSRGREAALREFLGFACGAADVLNESELARYADAAVPDPEDDKPPGRHPPEASGRPPVARVTRTRTRRMRRGGHGGSSHAAARSSTGLRAAVR